MMGRLFLLLALFWSGPAWAGLFCATDFSGRNCGYGDVVTCLQAVGQRGGCELNQAEMIKPVGGAPYCLVESWRTECIYADVAACRRRAEVVRSVCIVNPNAVGGRIEVVAGLGGAGTGVDASVGDGGRRYLPSPGYEPGGGVVVGAPSAKNHITESEIRRVHEIIGKRIVLVPGIGAQGGSLEFVLKTFGDYSMINVGRSVMYSKDPAEEARRYRDMINVQRTKI
ncbi:MAG: hypothetical protein HQL86_05635 [Magnetococcales bacterium]|nr:hypothetical protein [Magnetococcales bacterium]